MGSVSPVFVVGLLCMSLSGIFLSIQSGCNATLGGILGGTLASVSNFATGLVALLGVFMVDVLAISKKLPTMEDMQDAHWWTWIGGPLGAFYVTSNIIFAPILGSGILTSIFVTGQLCTAVVLDARGWVGFKRREVRWQRILGLVLMIAGVLLVALFRGDEVTPRIVSDGNNANSTGLESGGGGGGGGTPENSDSGDHAAVNATVSPSAISGKVSS